MRSEAQTVEGAWTLMVAGAEPTAVSYLTSVSMKTLARMRTALNKLAKHAPECSAARMTWKEADQRAATLDQARTIAEAIRKAAEAAPVRVVADALAMASATLPGALMDHWTSNNVTRGVRHVETEAHA